MEPSNLENLLTAVQKNTVLLKDLEEIAKVTAAALGLLYIIPGFEHVYRPIPITLVPTFIKRTALDTLVALQPEINLLLHRVSQDKEFLTGILKGAAQVDPFTKNLIDIYDQVEANSQWELGLNRTDYILHHTEPCTALPDILERATFKMVEMNTICVGPAGICSMSPQVHQRMLHHLGIDRDLGQPETLPLYGKALSMAHSVYCEEYPSPTERVMLFVVHKGFEFNVLDQRMTELESGVKTLRRNLTQIAETLQITPERALFVEGYEVAVVYYRTAYAPSHYDGKEDWDLRKVIEFSRAIKTPSIAYQLAGSKKVQQELSRPEVLKRFLPEVVLRDQLSSTFVGQWDLSDASSSEIIEKALEHPELYVLKPNREGGGNNFYNGELVAKIHEVRGTSEASGFILMDKIQAPFQKNIMFRPNKPPALMETINEVGIFGVILAKGQDVRLNGASSQALVRSKASDANEGGLAVGLSCFSCSFMV